MSNFSFFFYDLETSGLNPRIARIMQFAGQRTDENLKPIGEPVNELIRLTSEVVPSPGAILVTGITPQQTLDNGVTEAQFLELFYEKVATPGTVFVGYNSIRFDDEFMRFLMWRNFYDPYVWQWRDNRSRWDLLDVVRLARALRPAGVKWPVGDDGRPANKLELLASENKLEHSNAHDALSDVTATIALAKLLKTKQPELFDYLLTHRDKQSVKELVERGQPFVYASGKYASEFQKTTAAIKLADRQGGALVYDLRHDPAEFINLPAAELAERWQYTKDETAPARLPVKTMKFNRCPAIAPLGALDESSQERLALTIKTIKTNMKKLAAAKGFAARLTDALTILDDDRKKARAEAQDAESQLYDNFIDDADKPKLPKARQAITAPGFSDKRLEQIWPRYKARNYPQDLSAEERAAWDEYCKAKLTEGGESSALAKYFRELAELSKSNLATDKSFLLEELQLYGESLLPADY